MIDFSSVLIQQLAIHRVGNKHREETNFISEKLTDLGEDMEELMTKYFLKPFSQATENYHSKFKQEDVIIICGHYE